MPYPLTSVPSSLSVNPVSLCYAFAKTTLTTTALVVISSGLGVLSPAPAQAGPSGRSGISFTIQMPANWGNLEAAPTANPVQSQTARLSTAAVETELHHQQTVAEQQTGAVFRDQYWAKQTINGEQVSLEVF